MSTAEVKELFYNATNAKIVYGHDEGFAEETLRQAVTLSSTLTDQVWPFITAYRLAHLLFRKAKLQSDFEEILKLVERAEASSSRYISIHSKFLKFTALNRLRMLGILGLSERQKVCLDEIITGIGDLQRVSNSTDYFNKPVQGEFFNILEYLLYNSEGDFKYPEGIGYDENNILFPRRTNDAWRLIGPAGPLTDSPTMPRLENWSWNDLYLNTVLWDGLYLAVIRMEFSKIPLLSRKSSLKKSVYF